MAVASAGRAADGDDDGVAVVLDGEQEQDHGLHGEVNQKLDGLAKARKIRPWNPRRFSDDMSVLEMQRCHSHENNNDGEPVRISKSKGRLEGLLTTLKSDDGKHTPRATFKPIRLAVAKARDIDDTGNIAAGGVASTSRHRETTLTLPDLVTEGVPGTMSTDVLNNGDNEDAASYIEFPQGPSPSMTRTSSDSTSMSRPESDNSMLQGAQKPFAKLSHSPSSATNPTASPNASGNTLALPEPTASTQKTSTKWKRPSKKSSRLSSQDDLQDLPESIDYAEINTARPRSPNRTDTARKFLARSSSFNYRGKNSLRLAIPFRGLHKRRKGKGRMGEDDDSSSQEAIDDDEIFQETLRRAGLLDKDVPEQIVTEALWQNERGLHLLGSRYGRNALLPGDPGSWTDLHGNSTAYNTSNFPLPTPAWRWHHAEWLISMIGDVDSEGYQYSTRFSSRYWRGLPEIRFLVRRRLWIRTRYRPSLKAQTIAQFTRPEADQAQPGYAAPRAGLPNAACTVPTMHKLLNGATSLSQSILASHLDPRNPFISWYALKAESRDEDKTPGSRLPLKEEVIHVDFLRVAKVLVRRTYVDRERLAWLEYWLGYRQEALHITDMLSHDQYSKSTTIGLQYEQQTSRTGSLANIEESGSVRPDVRDVWDVLEDQLDAILGLFEYQETRRELLVLLKSLHNTLHPEHHYKNRSSSPAYPSELSAQHEQGGTDELGADTLTRAANGDVTHTYTFAEERPRLAFWTDLNNRLNAIQVTTAITPVKNKPGPDFAKQDGDEERVENRQ